MGKQQSKAMRERGEQQIGEQRRGMAAKRRSKGQEHTEGRSKGQEGGSKGFGTREISAEPKNIPYGTREI
jgi:hypothetical protein